MNVCDALVERKSTRAFIDKPVEKDLINHILESASHAPSGTNTQPWQVVVVTGKTKQKLQQKLEAEYRSGAKSRIAYHYYPQQWQSPYKERRLACGLQLYSTLEIKRDDKQKQLDARARNFRAFDAPVMLLFFIDKIMEAGSYMDYGMFLQSIMLAAVEQGLATCPQAVLAEYPDIVKQQLGFDDDRILLCGISLGYEDKDAIINSYRTPRVAVDKFTQFFD